MKTLHAIDDQITAGDLCECEFTPFDDGDEEESFHYKRRCSSCGGTWYSLHCPHDLNQKPCIKCGSINEPVPEDS